MSNKRRKQKQVSIYLDAWLKVLVAKRATENEIGISEYIRELIRQDLGIAEDYHPMDIVITELENGVSLYDVKGVAK